MHFYKQMVGNYLHSMVLPEKLRPSFVERIGSAVKLKRPSGASWLVGLIRLSGKLVIQSGWIDFVTANDVEPNDLLVFKFVSATEFEVLIFDSWGCEKNDMEGITRNTSLPLELRDKPSISAPDNYVESSRKMLEEIQYSKFAEISETEAPAKKRPNQKSRKRKEVSGEIDYAHHSPVMSDKAATNNLSSMDFCNMHFHKQMNGLSMHKMTLPVIIRMNFKTLIGKVIQLKRPSGGTWHVSLIWTGDELVLQSGWNQFVVANDISQNDFIAFKFIGGSTFEVLIFDPMGYEKSSNVGKKMQNGLLQGFTYVAEPIRSKHDNYNGKSSEIEVYAYTVEDAQGSNAAAMIERNYFLENEQISCGVRGPNPSFVQVLKPSSLTIQCGINIPKKFSAEHLPKESQDILLSCPIKKKTWLVRYFYSQHQQFIRYAGWGKFVEENNLREGDVCSFELNKAAQPITFIVQVSRASDHNVES